MGLGYWLTEKVFYDPITGRELSDGTWVGQRFAFRNFIELWRFLTT